MNNRVTVTGMQVRTKVQNNLLIAETNAEANYGVALNQTRIGLLEPASTVDGINYWYTATNNVGATGDAKTDVYTQYSEATALANTDAGKTNYDAAFNTNYGVSTPTVSTVSYAYIDYVFYLKATNADSVDRSVYMTKCNLTYAGSAITEKAWRVALFSQDAVKDTALDTAIATTDLISILSPAGALNFVAGKAISANAAPSVDVAEPNTAAVIDSALASGATKYYKITVRLWLEGEDKTCNNDTFAELTNNWYLDLAFEVGDNTAPSNTAVTALASGQNATVSVSTLTATITQTDNVIGNGETVVTYAWKNLDGTAAAGTNNAASYTASADGKFYCEMTTAKGNVYYSPICDLHA